MDPKFILTIQASFLWPIIITYGVLVITNKTKRGTYIKLLLTHLILMIFFTIHYIRIADIELDLESSASLITELIVLAFIPPLATIKINNNPYQLSLHFFNITLVIVSAIIGVATTLYMFRFTNIFPFF